MYVVPKGRGFAPCVLLPAVAQLWAHPLGRHDDVLAARLRIHDARTAVCSGATYGPSELVDATMSRRRGRSYPWQAARARTTARALDSQSSDVYKATVAPLFRAGYGRSPAQARAMLIFRSIPRGRGGSAPLLQKDIPYYRRKSLTIEGTPLLYKEIPDYRRISRGRGGIAPKSSGGS